MMNVPIGLCEQNNNNNRLNHFPFFNGVCYHNVPPQRSLSVGRGM